MIGYVRAGAYLHVAAAAVGVAPATVSRWLARGEQAKSGVYAQFRQDVLAAVAEAAVVTEAELRRSKPEVWLKCGPRRLLGEDWQEDQQPTAVVNIETRAAGNSLMSIADALFELQQAGVISFGRDNSESSDLSLTPQGGPLVPGPSD